MKSKFFFNIFTTIYSKSCSLSFTDDLPCSNPHSDSNDAKKVALRFLAQPFSMVESKIDESEITNFPFIPVLQDIYRIERRFK